MKCAQGHMLSVSNDSLVSLVHSSNELIKSVVSWQKLTNPYNQTQAQLAHRTVQHDSEGFQRRSVTQQFGWFTQHIHSVIVKIRTNPKGRWRNKHTVLFVSDAVPGCPIGGQGHTSVDGSGGCSACPVDQFSAPGWAFCATCPEFTTTVGAVGSTSCGKLLLIKMMSL